MERLGDRQVGRGAPGGVLAFGCPAGDCARRGCARGHRLDRQTTTGTAIAWAVGAATAALAGLIKLTDRTRAISDGRTTSPGSRSAPDPSGRLRAQTSRRPRRSRLKGSFTRTASRRPRGSRLQSSRAQGLSTLATFVICSVFQLGNGFKAAGSGGDADRTDFSKAGETNLNRKVRHRKPSGNQLSTTPLAAERWSKC